jgi:hypothetical protein
MILPPSMRIVRTGSRDPFSNTALDLVGVGPGTRILDIAAGAGTLSGPADRERVSAAIRTFMADRSFGQTVEFRTPVLVAIGYRI